MIEFLKNVVVGAGLAVLFLLVALLLAYIVIAVLVNWPLQTLGVGFFLLSWAVGYSYRKNK